MDDTTLIGVKETSMPTLFTRIITGEIPSVKLYEDELCLVILDIFPINRGHALVISKKEYETIIDCPEEELSHLVAIARRVAVKMTKELKIDGFNIMINNRPASGQEVPHLHIHVIPRFEGDKKTPIMEKEDYEADQLEEYGRLLRL